MDELRRALCTILQRHLGHTCTASALRVEREGADPLELALGYLDPDENDATGVDVRTAFDLASLTKLFTTTAVLRLVGHSSLALDDRVHNYLPFFVGVEKELVTVRQLLTHTSGLPALVRLYGPAAELEDPWTTIFSQPLESEPGRQVVYSDVGFMLLGRLIEEASGMTLRQAMQRLVLAPLGLVGVDYGPCPAAPATELDPWRGRRLRGEVHDENAAVLGGVAGHAGLFGPAESVAKLARSYLTRDESFLPGWLLEEAVSEQAVTGYERRGLGWKLALRSLDAPESAFSAQTFGHYGFTGTAVWADGARGILVVLLTNRVYYGRDPEKIAALRREVFSVIVDSMEKSA